MNKSDKEKIISALQYLINFLEEEDKIKFLDFSVSTPADTSAEEYYDGGYKMSVPGKDTYINIHYTLKEV